MKARANAAWQVQCSKTEDVYQNIGEACGAVVHHKACLKGAIVDTRGECEAAARTFAGRRISPTASAGDGSVPPCCNVLPSMPGPRGCNRT